MKKYETALFIFRRDLRLEDNTALIQALQDSREVIPCFIFTPEQIENNPYRGDHALQLMLESLACLNEELIQAGGKLYFFYGAPEEVIKTLHPDAVFVNRDYTPYSIKRDQKISDLCLQRGIDFISRNDALLNAPEDTKKSGGDPYTVFTPYYKNALKIPVSSPSKTPKGRYVTKNIPSSRGTEIFSEILKEKSDGLLVKGGRKEGKKHLTRIKTLQLYEPQRDFPYLEATSHLSAYLKFGVLSVREVYHTVLFSLGSEHPLIRSLYWRDFFSSIAFFFPHVFSGAFHKGYDAIQWKNDKRRFELWCKGETGFPIVDAGMRQLNTTGFMHNRVRMIAASFLVKDLHLDWRLGEKYFAQKLVDYDPAVNNGNWQWAASTGCDAVPYFRIFNPWIQQKKFDTECIYIKTFIPELREESNDAIHNPDRKSGNPRYPLPILDHAQEAKITLEVYKTIKLH